MNRAPGPFAQADGGDARGSVDEPVAGVAAEVEGNGARMMTTTASFVVMCHPA